MKFLNRSLTPSAVQTLRGSYCTGPTYIYPSKEDEYSTRPLYPRITKDHLESPDKRNQKQWYDKIKRQLTVEEKLIEVNVPRKWGWKCFMVREGIIPFNNLVFAQHITRTHVIEGNDLPHYYDKYSEKALKLTAQIKNDVIDAIEYQLDVRHHHLSQLSEATVREKELTKIIIMELNRILINSLRTEESHLQSVQVDYSPRIEAFWYVNSMVETYRKKVYEGGIPLNELPEEYLERPSDKFIQYIGNPILQLRHEHPLPRLLDLNEANIFSYSVPVYNFDPHLTLGYELERRHVTNIPGFWPGDDRDFGFLSYHFSHHIKERPPTYGEVDTKEALQCQAIFASFGWLMPLACYQGFSTYHDVTYPLVTQTVMTDGQEFTFATYQLNTTELYHENPYENPKSNICWVTPTMTLYEAFENGKLQGFNEEVLSKLIKLYINSPQPLTDCKMKPYLGDNIKYVSDYEDEEKREWLENKFKFIYSNKLMVWAPLVYEVHDWERIFKIQFRMRPQDARKRPFELRENPYQQKMSDGDKGAYIPRALRPDKKLPKWRQKRYKRTFYPE